MKHFLTLLLLVSLTLAFSYAEEKDDAAVYREEIQLLNLYNGLELTPEQKGFIAEKCREALRIREESRTLMNNGKGDYVNVLKDISAGLKEGKETSPEMKERFHREEGRLKKLKEEGDAKVTALAEDVKAALNGHQQFLLEGYKPCIIPPPGPANIGQAENTEGTGKRLERIRALSDTVYQKQKDKLADKVIYGIKQHLPHGYVVNEDEEKERLLSLFDEVRSLSDIDYKLKEEKFIEEFKGKYALPKVPLDLTVKIERFFFTPLALSLLQ